MTTTETVPMQTQIDLPRDVSEGLRHVPRAALVRELRALIEKQKPRAEVNTHTPTFDNLPPQIAAVVAAIETSGGVSADTVEKMKASSREFREEFWLDKDQ